MKASLYNALGITCWDQIYESKDCKIACYVLTLQPRLAFAIISVKQHSDKKPLEGKGMIRIQDVCIAGFR